MCVQSSSKLVVELFAHQKYTMLELVRMPIVSQSPFKVAVLLPLINIII